MNANTLKETLGNQLTRILEETAFMLVEDSDAPLPEAGSAVEANLQFSGQRQGSFWLAVSEEGANHLANEMLGEELAEGSDSCEQAIAELLNILAAWVLDTWWGKAVDHDMGTPTAARNPFQNTVVWTLPVEQRVIVTTDAGYTFLCGVTLEN
jgi:chemotaxis protein CheY-P-specific phosphatase CheC